MTSFIDIRVLADDGFGIAIDRVYETRVPLDQFVQFCVGDSGGRTAVAKTVAVGVPPDMAEFDEARRAKRRYVRALEHHGWIVDTADGIPTPDRPAPYRADVDPLVIRSLERLPEPAGPLSTVLLLAADHAFSHAVRDARRRGWRVEVAAVDRITSDELRRSASDVIDVTDLVVGNSSNTGSLTGLVGSDLVTLSEAP